MHSPVLPALAAGALVALGSLVSERTNSSCIRLSRALGFERIGSRWRAFAARHFPARPYDYRQTWLDLSDRLAACTCRSDLEQAIPAAYCEVFGIARAMLCVRDGRSSRFVPARQAQPQLLFQPSPALLAYFQEQDHVWDPASGDPHAGEQELALVHAVQARLVVPLMCGKVLEGVVLLGAPMGKEHFSPEDHDLMKVIARQAGLLLCNQRLARELAEARELAAVARVSSFVVHDLKNQAQTLSLLLDNAEEHLGNTEFQQDMLSAVRQTLADMKLLMQKLKAVPGRDPAVRQSTDIRAICNEVVREFARTRTRAFLVCKGEPVLCAADRVDLWTVLVNLLQNGLDAAGEAGTIALETKRWNGWGRIIVTDNGCGMTAEFLEQQLFRPFRSTKKSGLGIGLFQSRQIVDSLGGLISVESTPGTGTTFTIDLPALAGGPAAGRMDVDAEVASPLHEGREVPEVDSAEAGKKEKVQWTNC